MDGAPYATGDRLELLLPDGQHDAVVSVVMRSGASDPERRWRLLCRDADTDRSIDIPVYCADDGTGDLVRPAQPDRDAALAARVAVNVPAEVAYVAACALGLAFSQRQGDDAVVDLLTAAEGLPETLSAARAALPTYAIQDTSVLQAARELLTSAEGAARLTAPAAG